MLPQGTLNTVNQQSRNLRINLNMSLSKWPVNSSLRQTPPNMKRKNLEFQLVHSILALSASNFETSASIDYTPILCEKNNQPLTYLQFTLRGIEEVTVPDTCLRMRGGCYIFYSQKKIKSMIEKETRKQAESEKWKEWCTFRYTLSNFHLTSTPK